MTEAHEPNDIDGPHEGPIKTPKQLVLAVFYSFVIPIFGIILLVMFVTHDRRPAAGSDALSDASTSARIRPVGVVDVKDLADPASMKSGEQVFAAQCTACHTSGALGSPKLGDADAWSARIKTGYDALLHSALVGKGQMPPQGGGDFSDFEIGRAVVYMANKAGGKLAEPVMAAASAPDATAAAPATAVVAGASAPAADANAGTPIATATAPLNAQLKDAPANATAAKAPAQGAAPATTGAVVATAATPAAAAAAPALYTQICSACHAAGVAGAPKLGDKAAWAPRIAMGIDALTASAIKGKGAMPPKGGSAASEAEIKAVVTYMVGAAK